MHTNLEVNIVIVISLNSLIAVVGSLINIVTYIICTGIDLTSRKKNSKLNYGLSLIVEMSCLFEQI